MPGNRVSGRGIRGDLEGLSTNSGSCRAECSRRAADVHTPVRQPNPNVHLDERQRSNGRPLLLLAWLSLCLTLASKHERYLARTISGICLTESYFSPRSWNTALQYWFVRLHWWLNSYACSRRYDQDLGFGDVFSGQPGRDYGRYVPTRTNASLVVQYNSQEGIVDLDLAVVLDETKPPEFIHEQIDPRGGMTFFPGSPCAKTVSFLRNLATFLPKPAESRNDCTSKARLRKFAFVEERRVWADARRTEDTML